MPQQDKDRAALAGEYFRQGYNCCQSVALAFSDIALEKGVGEEQLKALSSGFGGGFGRLREVCGCVSGMTLIAGFLSPSDPSDQASRKNCYALVQQLAAEFRGRNGSIVCRELLGLRSGQVDPPNPSERTPGFYHARPCEALVRCAASILQEKLQATTDPV